MTFDEWFDSEVVPSYAYSGTDPETLRDAMRRGWEAGYDVASYEACGEAGH